MIAASFLHLQTAESAKNRCTSPFLRKLILSVVDTAAKAHYRQDYSLKCLQTASALQLLLTRVRISSLLWVGAVCVAEVFEQAGVASWGGFWDSDHHFWLETEFQEYVDLGIGQLHLHPLRRRTDGIPMPSIWWNDIGKWPHVIRYLPDTTASFELDTTEDANDLFSFKAKVEDEFAAVLLHHNIEDIIFGPILSGLETMNMLQQQGHSWVVGALPFQESAIPFPEWIRQREREFMEAYHRGERPPSRLADVPHFLKFPG